MQSSEFALTMSEERDSRLYVQLTEQLRACMEGLCSGEGAGLSEEEKQQLLAAMQEDRISLQQLQLLHRGMQTQGAQDGALCSVLKGSRVLAAKKPPKPVDPELEARRQYLRAKQEQREYNAMVADIAPDMRPRENFSSYKDQLNVGLNIIVSMAVMYIVCYYAGGGIFREEWKKILCGLTGMVGIILVETGLFLVKEYEGHVYKEEKEKRATKGIDGLTSPNSER